MQLDDRSTSIPADAPRLADMPRGMRLRLLAVDALDARIALMHMGLMPGDCFVVTDVAAGGCPLAIKVRGSKLALRRSLAQHIRVVPA